MKICISFCIGSSGRLVKALPACNAALEYRSYPYPRQLGLLLCSVQDPFAHKIALQ